MVKFLILSDTHNFDPSTADPTYPLSQPLPKCDVLLHCGDLTSVGGLSSYKKSLQLLGYLDAELKLVIAGNHDLSLDGEYWKSHLDEDDDPDEHEEAMAIMKGPMARAAGVTYLEEGTYEFTLASGKSFKTFVSPHQPEFGDWAFGYPRDEERWRIPKDVDIVMTHGPPYRVLDFCDGGHVGCKTLLKEVESVRPLLHCFGHIHGGNGVEEKVWDWGKWDEDVGHVVKVEKAGQDGSTEEFKIARGVSTLMVNAAIMDEQYKPVNAPWVVELPL